jgi:hypothetical protein
MSSRKVWLIKTTGPFKPNGLISGMPGATPKKPRKSHAARATARNRRLTAADVCDSEDATLSNEVSRAAARASAK